MGEEKYSRARRGPCWEGVLWFRGSRARARVELWLRSLSAWCGAVVPHQGEVTVLGMTLELCDALCREVSTPTGLPRLTSFSNIDGTSHHILTYVYLVFSFFPTGLPILGTRGQALCCTSACTSAPSRVPDTWGPSASNQS